MNLELFQVGTMVLFTWLSINILKDLSVTLYNNNWLEFILIIFSISLLFFNYLFIAPLAVLTMIYIFSVIRFEVFYGLPQKAHNFQVTFHHDRFSRLVM